MSQFVKILISLVFFASFSFAQGPVSCYGKLQASGNKIVGSKTGTNAVQVRGVSLGWSNSYWESARFFDATTVNAMADSWRAEVIRAPMGYSEDNGYQSQPTQNQGRIEAVVSAAISKGVYVIIDWHSHSAHNEKNAAISFFEDMAKRYGNNDHVIFEIYNEPLNIPWTTIKSYAEEVITAIRRYSSNLILVGTPNWDQNVDVVTSTTKVSGNNVAYVFHFYAASHTLNSFQSKINTILNTANLPIFVTEWGTTHSDGGQNNNGNYSTHSAINSDAWMSYLDENKISSCAWNVNDKYEGSAFFGIQGQAGQFDKSSWTNTSKMTPSGQYVYNKLTGYYASAPWRNCPYSSGSTNQSSSSSGGTVASTIIDNFEDGDGLANTYEPWYIYTDAGDGGTSTIGNSKDGNSDYIVVDKDGSNGVAYVKNYSLSKGTNKYDPYVTLGLDAKDNQKTYNLNLCTGGFSYRYKGAAHNFKVEQSNVADYAYHFKEASNASTGWTTVTAALASLVQPDWASPSVTRDITKVKAFSWEIKGGLSTTTGSLMIDDFTCLGTMPLPPKPSSNSVASSSSKANSSSSNRSSSSVASSSSRANSSSSNRSSSSVASSSSRANSSSSRNTTNIMLSPVASKNEMLPMHNGVSLQVLNNATLEIFNLNGKLFRKMDFASGVHSVQLSDLPKSLYIVRVQFGNRREVLYVPIK